MFQYLLISCLIVAMASGKTIEIKCPNHCKCDLFEHYKRANCTHQKLVSMESYLPNETELLDLSFNQISHIDDNTFFDQNLLSLKLLNISHNKLAQIHMHAFAGLNNLRSLDLSYNAMEYITINWFWNLNSLQELYLKGNSFGRFSDEPFIESRTLTVLDISSCGISHIGLDAFTKVSNLEVLDISQNYLIQLDVRVVKPLKKLTTLKARNNSFSCNNVMVELSSYCVKSGIRYEDPCFKQKIEKTDKFQRIINLVEPVEEKNSWIFDDAPPLNTTVIVEKCNVTKTEEGLLIRIINLSPVLAILIPFVYGIALGILLGCSVQIRSKRTTSLENVFVSDDNASHLRRTRSLNPLRRSNSLYNRKNNTEACESLVLTEWNVPESTPMTPRKFQDHSFS